MSEHNGACPLIDITRPNEARIHDYLLGGNVNYGADRAAAEELKVTIPHLAESVRDARDFHRRVVRYVARKTGIRQFIAVSGGLPTQDNVHAVAQAITPDARAVYVDRDPMTVTLARALLARTPGVTAVLGGSQDLCEVLHGQQLQALVDLDRPVAILLMRLFTGEATHVGIGHLGDVIAPGSYLAATYPTVSCPNACSDGLRLVEPGFVDVRDWRPDSDRRHPTAPTLFYGGVAHKPLLWAVAA
ncbi:SAM-dependent methyltransferase [Nonomuraea sediminis]|uniref:SAM-dependent methyltransferase n=1 Tax=Nonomuraea sediminis TaxID=2835864 RepID=UPI001BDCD0BB|nr:SAM-dependent methyltransferase [Nonomuraea sediminis]